MGESQRNLLSPFKTHNKASEMSFRAPKQTHLYLRSWVSMCSTIVHKVCPLHPIFSHKSASLLSLNLLFHWTQFNHGKETQLQSQINAQWWWKTWSKQNTSLGNSWCILTMKNYSLHFCHLQFTTVMQPFWSKMLFSHKHLYELYHSINFCTTLWIFKIALYCVLPYLWCTA